MDNRFRNQSIGRGLGDLPGRLANERGEVGAIDPYGLPPPASLVIPAQGQAVQQTDPTLQSSWASIQFVVDTVPIKIQDALARKFFLIQNRSGVATLAIGFGFQPTLDNGLILPPGVGYEPFRYPVNDIWVVADMAGASGILIYGT